MSCSSPGSKTRALRIARLPKVRIIERADLDASAFTAAGVQSARALALLRQDDLGNVHAALRAQALNPELRLVVATSTPAWASASGRSSATARCCRVRPCRRRRSWQRPWASRAQPYQGCPGSTPSVARRTDSHARRVVCGLAMTQDPQAPRAAAAGRSPRGPGARGGGRCAPQPARPAAQAPGARGRRPGRAPALEQAGTGLRRAVRRSARRVPAAPHP